MALANLSKAVVTCVGICVASAGLTGAQLSGAENFSWAGAVDDFPNWLNTAPNPWLLLTTTVSAVFAILGAVAAVAQLRAPKAYPEAHGKLDRQHQNESFKAADDRAGARQDANMAAHDATLAAVVRDKHDQALADLAGGNNPDLIARYDQVRAALTAKGITAPAEAIANAAITAEALAASVDPAEQAIGELLAEGRFREAARARADMAERRLIEAGRPIAEELREAGRLALPFSPNEALDYFSRATDLDPEDVWAWIELGRLRAQYGSLADARACFGAALQRVTDERDRMVLHNEFGNVLVTEGQLNEARSKYEAGLAIAETLSARDPDNSIWLHDLSVSYNKFGDVEVAAGNLDAARARFEARLAIAETLAGREPGNAGWQRDLFISNAKLAQLAEATGDPAATLSAFRRAEAIMARLAEAHPHHPGFARDLAQVRGDIARLEGAG